MKLRLGMMFVLMDPHRIGVHRRYTEQVCRITKKDDYRYIFEGVFIVDDVEYALWEPYDHDVIRPLRNENTVVLVKKKKGLLNSHSMVAYQGKLYRVEWTDGDWYRCENVFDIDDCININQHDVNVGIVRIL